MMVTGYWTVEMGGGGGGGWIVKQHYRAHALPVPFSPLPFTMPMTTA